VLVSHVMPKVCHLCQCQQHFTGHAFLNAHAWWPRRSERCTVWKAVSVRDTGIYSVHGHCNLPRPAIQRSPRRPLAYTRATHLPIASAWCTAHLAGLNDTVCAE
jgi:hypothetical protein